MIPFGENPENARMKNSLRRVCAGPVETKIRVPRPYTVSRKTEENLQSADSATRNYSKKITDQLEATSPTITHSIQSFPVSVPCICQARPVLRCSVRGPGAWRATHARHPHASCRQCRAASGTSDLAREKEEEQPHR